MEEQDKFPPAFGKTMVQALVTVFDRSLVNESLKTAVLLRQAGIRAQIYFDPDPLREQIAYANAKAIPYVVIVGPDEAEKGLATVRELSSKQQEVVRREQLAAWILERIA
jgi:histidyl-tRNA synthetase